MAVLQKIRDKAGVAVSIIIALALLSFIIDPGTLETVWNSTSSKYDVGVIGGKKVTYTDFQDDVEEMTVFYKFMTNNSNQNDQVQKQIRELTWNDLITRNLFIKNAKAAGINVGTEEMLALTTGENPSQIIASHPMFADENGVFSSDKVREFVQGLSSASAEASIVWKKLQSNIEAQQYMTKYNALFSASSILNALQLESDVTAGNTTATIEYVMKPYSYKADTTVTVPESKVKAYYTKNKKNYRQKASRDIKFALFEVVPSKEDIDNTYEDFNTRYEEFKTTDNVKAFVSSESEYSYDDRWYKDGELNTVAPEVNKFVFGEGKGVSPVFTSGNTFRAVRVLESAMVPDSAYVRHIMLQGADVVKADSLLTELKKGADFSLMAAAYSVDQQSAADGQMGNIGWLTQNYMFPGMESVLTAQVNAPYIIKTSYGTHIVCVTRKSSPIAKKKVAVFEVTAVPGKATYSQYYAQANALATLAQGTAEGLEKAADSLNVTLRTQKKISEATESYSGVDQAKEVTRWAFEAKNGKCSSIITVNNNYYFVVAVDGIHKEGYTPYEDVKASIEQMLVAKASEQKQKEEFAAAIQGKSSMEEIAQIASAEVETSVGMSLSNRPGQNDPALAGAAFYAPENKICGPVAGRGGMYVVKVSGKEAGTFYTGQDAKDTAEQMSQYSSQNILPVMIEEADVKDNRARFY